MLVLTTSRIYEARASQDRVQDGGTYRAVLIIALALCWSPSKPVAYAAPWIVIGWLVTTNRCPVTLRNVALLLAGYSGASVLYAVLTPGFALHSAVLSLLTYGVAFFVLAVPASHLARRPFEGLSILRWTVAIQGIWGMVQGVSTALRLGTFDGAVGDAVAGTIRPFARQPDMSNPMYAINMSLMLIVLLPSLLIQKRGGLAYLIGVVSLIMASVMHVLMLLVAALAFSFVIYYPAFLRRRSGIIATCGLLLATLLASALLSGNISTVRNYVRYTVTGRTPRAQVVVRVFSDMPDDYPWMPVLGLGPGQFTSRAGLIGTGMYFGTPASPRSIPLLPHGMSTPFERYALDLWMSLFYDRAGNYVHSMDNTSSTVKPYFSWLSVYTEFGVIGFASIVLAILLLLWTTRRHVHSPSQRLAAASFGAGVLLLFLLGIQENYWEVPQAIFVGVVILKAQYASIVGRQHLSPEETQDTHNAMERNR